MSHTSEFRPPGTLRILIVEDDPNDRELLELYLRNNEFSCEIEFVDEAQAMRAALARTRFDLIISDHRLPHFSSSAALEMTQELDPAPPFILVSGFIGETAAVEALHQGATDFVMKNNLARLGPAIARALNNAAVRENAREMERALRDSEARFRSLTEIAPAGIYLTDPQQRCVWINEQCLALSGRLRENVLGRDWREVFCVDAAHSRELLESQAWSFEARIERSGDAPCWVIGQMIVERDPGGAIIGYIGVITDISARKQAELELIESEARLRQLSIHMVGLEENLRAAVAREVHDDIGSSLTGIKLDLALLRHHVEAQGEAHERLHDLGQLVEAAEVSSRRIIKALRPSVLDHGIVPALQWQLAEFEKRFSVRAQLSSPQIEPALEEHEAVALFRIVQEALNNIAKHAQAKKVEVTLATAARLLTLEISDDGVGLSEGVGERQGSFGIIGMRERIQSLGGWLEVNGASGQGVTLMFGMPFRSAKSVRQA